MLYNLNPNQIIYQIIISNSFCNISSLGCPFNCPFGLVYTIVVRSDAFMTLPVIKIYLTSFKIYNIASFKIT